MKTNRTAETLSAKKHLRRTLPAALVLLAICLVFTAPVGAADTWDGTSSTTWYGDGSAETFTLNTAEDLAGLASLVNSGTSFSGKTVYLADDINLADLGWTPIGYRTDYVTDGTRPFEGIFDGGYHRISGLKITENNIHTGTSSEENAFVGLFGYIYGGTVVKNVIVEGDITITLTESSLYDTVYAGGVVGYPYGSGLARVENCSSDVSITITNNKKSGVVHAGGIAGHAFSSTFVNTSSTGFVSATGYSIKVGGLVGSHVGASGNTLSYITNCYATGDVTGTTPEGNSYQVDTGGLVGFSQLTTSIINCYATGDVTSSGIENTNRVTAGGIIGYTETEIHIRDCFATGDVSGTGKCSNYFVGVGGLVGRLHANSDVENCYAIGDVSGTGTGDSAKVYVGGIAGTPYYSDIVNSYALNQHVSASGTASEFQVNRAVGEGETYQTILSNYGWVGTNVNGTTVTSDDVASVHGKDVGLAWNTLFAGWDSSIWEIGTAENYKLPILKGMPSPVADASYLKVETHTVTFYENGGSDVTDQTLITGDKVSEPTAPTKAGHTFEGWYTEEALTNKYDFSSVVNSDINLYANWVAVTYTVTYDANGGTGSMEPVAAVEGKHPLKENVFTAPEGKLFAGWEVNGELLNPGSEITVTEDITIYANWTATLYNISFYPNGGTGEMENITVPHGGSFELPENAFEAPTGYEFAIWCNQSDWESGTVYSVGWKFENVVSDMSFYAQWSLKTYYITFNTDGGTPVEQKDVEYNATIFVFDEPTKEGYTFTGWSPALPELMPAENLTVTAQWTAKTYTVTWIDGESKTTNAVTYGSAIIEPSLSKEGYTGTWLPAVPSTMPAKNMTFNALWTPETHTVTFENNTGSGIMNPVKVSYDEKYILPASAFTAPDSYTFNGWNISGTVYQAGANITITGDVTAKAEWKAVAADNVTVHFNTDGGYPIPESVEIPKDNAVTQPENPDKEGSKFTGWYTEDGKLWDFSTPVSKEMTLTAGWEVIPQVHEVIVLPQKVVVVNGTTQQFTAEVLGVGNYDKKVTWNVERFADTGSISSTIDQNGLLKVADGDVWKNLEVTATVGGVEGSAVVSVEAKPAPVEPEIAADAVKTGDEVTVTFMPNDMAAGTLTQIEGQQATFTDTTTGVSTTVKYKDEPKSNTSTVTGTPASVVITFPEAPVETFEDAQKKFQLEIDVGNNVTFDLPVIDSTLRPEIDALIVDNESVAMITAENVDGINNMITNDGVILTFIVEKAWYEENKDWLHAYHVKSDGTINELALTAELKGGVYHITVKGDGFSSYVLALEEGRSNEGESGGDSETQGGTNYVPSTPSVKPSTPTTPEVPDTPKVTSETKEIPTAPENTETLPTGDKVVVVTLENTEVIQSVAVPEAVAQANPEASVKVTEGGNAPALPENVAADDVHIVVGVSVVDKEGNPVKITEPGYFILDADVPEGKKLVVGHYKNGIWVDCLVEDLGNGHYKVHYNGLSPFAAVIIEEHEESPFAAEEKPTEKPAETPAPILGMVLGGLAAAVVLRRK